MKKRLTVLLASVFLTLLTAAAGGASNIYTHSLSWGSSGTGDGQFGYDSPISVAVDPAGDVYAVDTGNNRIEKFDPNGHFLTKWGSLGSGNGQFYFNATYPPAGQVAVDASGNVYVSDSYNGRIQKFDSNGNWLATFNVYFQNSRPFVYGVAADASGNIYVALYYNACVQKLDPNGHLLVQWGSLGYGNGQFNGPMGVAVDAGGNVYVADSNNNRVEKFDSNGNYLAQWGSSGTTYYTSGTYRLGPGVLSDPAGVAVDASGNVYVTGTTSGGTGKIGKFDPNGNLLVAIDAVTGENTSYAYGASGVAVDGPGSNVYAAVISNTIMKFVADGTLTATALYNGQPLQNAYAYLLPGNQPAPGRHYQSALHLLGPSDASGTITGDEPPGSYYMRITKRTGSASIYGPPYPGDYTWTASNPPTVTIASNQTTSLGMVNTTVFGGPISISGTVRGASGRPLAGWAVKAATVPCESGNWAYAHSFNECGKVKYPAYTDANGNYTINLKDAGTYYVYASPQLNFANTSYPGGYPTCSTSIGCEACGDYYYFDCPVAVSGPLAGQNIVVPGY